MTSKELFLSNEVKDDSLVNCTYGRINNNIIYEIGESKEYIWREKTFRVTILNKNNDKYELDFENTKTFSGFGTFENKNMAYEYVRELKRKL